MKANEVPKKIYLHIRPNKEIGSTWHANKISDTDIDYTRTDAFIEKAKKWFEENFKDFMNVHKWEISTYEFENIQSMIDEFRKYMKGE